MEQFHFHFANLAPDFNNSLKTALVRAVKWIESKPFTFIPVSSDVFIGFMFFFLTQHQFKMDINGAAISICPLERFRVRFTHTLLHCSLSTLCCGGELWLKELSQSVLQLLCQTVSSWKVPVWAHSPAKIRRKRKKRKSTTELNVQCFSSVSSLLSLSLSFSLAFGRRRLWRCLHLSLFASSWMILWLCEIGGLKNKIKKNNNQNKVAMTDRCSESCLTDSRSFQGVWGRGLKYSM